jgi:MerR family transcriptional regulator, light-induced transcriptional regulator
MAAHGEFSMDQWGAVRPEFEDRGIGRAARSQPIFNLETRFMRSRVEDAIEADICPKLVLLHREPASVSADRKPAREDIERLANLAIGNDETAAMAHFEKVSAQQHSFATLLAYLVAPAAQHLGELWKQDLCDIFDITVGQGRLQAIMDRFSSTDAESIPDLRRRAVLIAPPGETQVFSAKVIERFLEATGWDVTFERVRRADDATNAVADEWVSVVGVTVSAVTRLEIAAKTIAKVRASSRNRYVGVMVGGSIFAESPRLVAQVGADGAWLDPPSAAALATHLLMRQGATNLL